MATEDLGPLVRSITLQAGLLGKKPVGIEIRRDGLVIMYKNGVTLCPFSQIGAIRTMDYFAPNPISYAFDILDSSGSKIATISILYKDRGDATALLEAHRDYLLGVHPTNGLIQDAFPLDNHLSWERGALVYRGRKGVEEYPLSQIDRFVMDKGACWFTLKDSKHTLGVFLDDAQNCLFDIAACQAISALANSAI